MIYINVAERLVYYIVYCMWLYSGLYIVVI